MDTISMIFLYLDPGTGSLLIQFLIAGVTGFILFFKQVKLKLIYLLHYILRKKNKNSQ